MITISRARVSSTLSAPDRKLMRRVNRWRAPRWVRWWMLGATRAGDGWLWGLIGLARTATRDRFSCPSGHSTTAFAVALSLGSFYPEIMPVLLALAINVAVSRVIVGMHFLSDVLAGSGMGALLGYAAFRFAA